MRRTNLIRSISAFFAAAIVISMTGCSAKSSADVDDTTIASLETEAETETEEETIEPSGNDVSSNDVAEAETEDETEESELSSEEETDETEAEAEAEDEKEEETTSKKTSGAKETTKASENETTKAEDNETTTASITVPASVQESTAASVSASTTTTKAETTQAAAAQATTAADQATTQAAITTSGTTVYSFDSVGLEMDSYPIDATGLTSLTPCAFYINIKNADVYYKVGDTIDLDNYYAVLCYPTDTEGVASYRMTSEMQSKITLSTYTASSLGEIYIPATYEDMTTELMINVEEGLLDISYGKEAFDIMNGYRAEEGLEPWVWSDEAYEVACKRAEELSIDYSHAFWHGWGENIVYFSSGLAVIDSVPKKAMTMWKESPGHYATMMSPGDDDLPYVAVAFYQKGIIVYGVTIFVN